MAKRVFARPFQGVRDKEIYPTEFKAGDFCPPELLEAAEICEVLEPEDDGGEKGKAKGKGRKSGSVQALTGDGAGEESGEGSVQTQTGEGTGQTSIAATGSDQGQA